MLKSLVRLVREETNKTRANEYEWRCWSCLRREQIYLFSFIFISQKASKIIHSFNGRGEAAAAAASRSGHHSRWAQKLPSDRQFRGPWTESASKKPRRRNQLKIKWAAIFMTFQARCLRTYVIMRNMTKRFHRPMNIRKYCTLMMNSRILPALQADGYFAATRIRTRRKRRRKKKRKINKYDYVCFKMEDLWWSSFIISWNFGAVVAQTKSMDEIDSRETMHRSMPLLLDIIIIERWLDSTRLDLQRRRRGGCIDDRSLMPRDKMNARLKIDLIKYAP